MRNSQPTRRRLEAMAAELDFDVFEGDLFAPADSVVDALATCDELAEAGDLLELIEAELLAHEVRGAGGDVVELANVVRFRLGEIRTVRGWAA